MATLQRDGAVSHLKVDSSERQWLASNLSADTNLLALQYTPDGKRIVVAGDMLHAIDAADGSVLAELPSPSGSTRGLAIRSDSQVVYSIVESGRILHWDLAKREFAGPQLGVKNEALFATAAGSDKFAFVDLSGAIRLCDTSRAPDAQMSKVGFAIEVEAACRLAMSRNGKLMAAAATKAKDELQVHFFDLQAAEPQASRAAGTRANSTRCSRGSGVDGVIGEWQLLSRFPCWSRQSDNLGYSDGQCVRDREASIVELLEL